MKLCILTLSCVILAASGATYVSELLKESKTDYLPPQKIRDTPSQGRAHEHLLETASNEELASEVIEAAVREAALEEAAVLGDQGYEYKTPVLRNHRDVSHLKFGYLPPFHLPLTKYLPPSTSKITEEQKQSKEYLPPLSQKEIEMSVGTPQFSNEFLPPLSINKTTEKLSDIESQSGSEYLPPAKLEDVGTASKDLKSQVEKLLKTATEAAAHINEAVKAKTEGSEHIGIASYAEETTTDAAGETENAVADSVEETAVFAKDGYHYKTPCEIPAELHDVKPMTSESPIVGSREYLPTLQKGARGAEGPNKAESSLLAEDGYYYRIIKRIF